MLISFVAVAQDEFKRDYDASFSVQVTGPASQQEIQQVVNAAITQFQQYHPGGRILQQVVTDYPPHTFTG